MREVVAHDGQHRGCELRVGSDMPRAGRVWLALAVTVSLLGLSAAAQPATAEMTMTATVAPARVGPGGMVSINASFSTGSELNLVNLSLEVRDPSGARVFQKIASAQAFSAGQSRNVAARWAVPSTHPGTYTVQLGAFSNDWQTGYGWNDQAATITVADSFANTVPTTYYVDCLAGDDHRLGTQIGDAWATLAPVNQASIQPGDTVALKRGCAWAGPLEAAWSGAPQHPITITGYGIGDPPLIQNGDFSQIHVTGSYLVLDGLHVRADPPMLDHACNNNPVGYRLGIYFGAGSTRNVVQNSIIEDTGAGVDVGPGSSWNIIRANEIRHNNMMWTADPWVNDGGGDGVLIQGDNNEVSYNHISGSLACSQRYIYDGAAVELLGAKRNSIHHNRIEHNYVFAEVSEAENNDFAYNISYDGGFTHHITATGTKLYNNVFYVPGGPGIISCGPCTSEYLAVVNNIFVAVTGIYGTGALGENHNIYWNPDGPPFNSGPLSPSSLVADPRFVDAAIGDFRLLPDSPAIGMGSEEPFENGYTVDMDGVSVKSGGRPNIGAFETR